MPTFDITSPEGKTFRITAPDGATKEQALAYAKSNMPAPKPPTHPARPTGPLPGEPGYGAHQPKEQPSGLLDYVLSQGGRFERKPAAERMFEGAMAGSEAFGGMGPAAQVAGKGVQAAGKIGEEVGQAVGTGIGKGATLAGNGLANVVGGLGTGTGGEPLKEAARAGAAGGEAARSFLQALRSNPTMDNVVTMARSAVGKIRDARNAAYTEAMKGVKGNTEPVTYETVDKALDDAKGIVSYKGHETHGHDVFAAVKDKVDAWKKDGLTSVEDFDALKKEIGVIKNDASAQGAIAAQKVYDALEATITAQAPVYTKIMKDYHVASDGLKELERALTGVPGASKDAALRKLQSVMRNNANTNYGNRLKLANQLGKQDPTLLPTLAGHALSSVTPRGIHSLAATGAGLGGLSEHSMLAALPFQSPRLMGEAAYYLGKGGGALGKAGAATSRTVGKVAGYGTGIAGLEHMVRNSIPKAGDEDDQGRTIVSSRIRNRNQERN